jgi:hypothetical protein
VKKAPSTLSMWFCRTCGRMDHGEVRERHFTGSQLCGGSAEALTYRLDNTGRTTQPSTTDTDVEDSVGTA